MQIISTINSFVQLQGTSYYKKKTTTSHSVLENHGKTL